MVPFCVLNVSPNPFSDMHGPILFKLSISTAHNGVHVLLTLFCDLSKDGQLEDWWPFLSNINMGQPFNSFSKITKTMGAVTFCVVFTCYVFPLGGRRIIFVLIIIIIFLILVSPHFRSVNSNF